MPFLETQRAELRAGLKPASDYTKRARASLDQSSPKAAGQLRHIQVVEQAVQSAIDYARAAQQEAAAREFIARVRAHLAEPSILARYEQPRPLRELLAHLTAHHLPRNPLLDELRPVR